MATLEQMGPAPRRYRPILNSPQFPTAEYCRAWDHRNARKLIRQAGLSVPGPHRRAMRDLASIVDPGELGPRSPIPMTMASTRWRRRISDRVCGHLWRALHTIGEHAHFFTLIPTWGEVPIGELGRFDPAVANERLRAALNAKGAVGSDGVLFAVWEAEYQIRTGTARFHTHGVASGEKLDAVHRLVDTRAFATTRAVQGEPRADVAYRKKVRRVPLFNLPDPLTYCIKHWYARWVTPEGHRGRRLRLPDEAAVEALLWQHQHSLTDCTLLMGLRPTLGGFRLINSTRAKGE